MKSISVVIPAYNAQAYIAACLDSLLRQEFSDMEIIVVNDGSKDDTLKIVQGYQKRHPDLIRIIDQENKGMSGARNAGIDLAEGRYITFIDSDDTIEPGMYPAMMEKAKERDFDVVTCGVNILYPHKNVRIDAGVLQDCHTKADVKSIMNTWYQVVWNKFYKRELLQDIRFKEGVWYEDVEFLYRLIPEIRSIGVVDGYYCNYIQRENSITYTYSDKLYHLIKNFNSLLVYYREHGYYEEYRDELEYAYVRAAFATFIKRLSKAKDKQRFVLGVQFAKDEVKKHVPNYKNNRYICSGGMKNKYLKYFNGIFARLVYIRERDRMN